MLAAELRDLANYRARFAVEFAAIEAPSGPVRRRGIEGYARDELPAIEQELLAIDRIDRTRPGKLHAAACGLTDLTLRLASFLYAAGADHCLWRRWTALTAFGMYLTGRLPEAAIYGILAGEWRFVEVLPPTETDDRHVSDRVIWRLAGRRPVPHLPERGEDDFSDAWIQLAYSAAFGDHPRTERCLAAIADDWIGMSDGDWREFHPEATSFEPTACAAAALARHKGYVPQELTPEQWDFLEPGLVTPEPPPLYPDYVELPGLRS